VFERVELEENTLCDDFCELWKQIWIAFKITTIQEKCIAKFYNCVIIILVNKFYLKI
jgi:hypothetical protein